MVSYRNLDDQRATPPPLLRAVVVGGGAPPKRIEMERSGPIDTDSNAVWKTYTSYSGNVTEACRAHLESADRLDVQQTLHGCFQELCCEARTEFRYFNTKGMNIAESMEDTNCCCRICCG